MSKICIYILLCVLYSYCLKSIFTKKIHVIFMAPSKVEDNSENSVTLSTSRGALSLAIKYVQERGLFNDHHIKVTWVDSECDSKTSIGKLVDAISDTPVSLILGPPCTKAMIPVALLAAYKNIAVFSWTQNTKALADRTQFSTLLKIFPPVSSLATLVSQLFLTWKWKNFVVISSKELNERARSLEAVFSYLQGINLVHHYSLQPDKDDLTSEDIHRIYNSLRKEARIILFVVHKSDLRRYLIIADKMNMTDGEYQFLFTEDRIPYNFLSNYELGNQLWKYNDTDDVHARQAYKSLLYITLGGFDLTNFTAEAMTAVSNEHWNTTFKHLPHPHPPDEFAPFLHDAFILYALTYNQTVGNKQPATGENIMKIVQNVAFKGKSGDVVLTPSNQREGVHWVFSMDKNGSFKLAMSIGIHLQNDPIRRWTEYKNTQYYPIIWGNEKMYFNQSGYVPPDEPLCGYENDRCPSIATPTLELKGNDVVPIVVPSVAGGVVFIVCIVVAFMYKKMLFERDLANMSWKIPYDSLEFCHKYRSRLLPGESFSNIRASAVSVCSNDDSFINESTDRLSIAGGSFTAGFSRRGTNTHLLSFQVAKYHNNLVIVKQLAKNKIVFDRAKQMEMRMIFQLKHHNVASFVGAAIEAPNIYMLWEYCNKGSIQNVIHHETLCLDNMFKLSILADICLGMEFIHSTPIKVHGRLQSSTCLIDSRWVCKLTDFGMRFLYDCDDSTDKLVYTRLYWTAPEILRHILEQKSKFDLTQEGDVFGFGIIIMELFCWSKPYNDDCYTAKEIIHKVAYPRGHEPFRPSLSHLQIDPNGKNAYMLELARTCWAEDPSHRPTYKSVHKMLDRINPYKKTNVVDNMITMMEKYSDHLEDLVADRTEQLQEEKKKTDALLYRMLPRSVAEDLKLGKPVQAETYEAVTIYFSDIVSFTTLAGNCTPMQVVHLLNSLYTLFDDIISKYDVYKVETIGDAYMIVSGLPARNADRHVTQIADVSLHLISGTMDFRLPHKPSEHLEIRIGLHTGPVVSGVVGLTMPRYCLFGDSVNTASRMESSGKPMRIHISTATFTALSGHTQYQIIERGYIDIKGKGRMKTYWLIGKTGFEYKLPTFDATSSGPRKISENMSLQSVTQLQLD